MFVVTEFHIKIISYSLDHNMVLVFSVYRQLGLSLYALAFLYYTKIHPIMSLSLPNITYKDNPKEMRYFIARVILLYSNGIFLTYSIMNLKQMDVIIITNVYPLIKNIVAPYFLNQKFQVKYLLVTFISFIKILL